MDKEVRRARKLAGRERGRGGGEEGLDSVIRN